MRKSRIRSTEITGVGIFIKAPPEVLDRFVDFTNQNELSSYWRAIELLLDVYDGVKAGVNRE